MVGKFDLMNYVDLSHVHLGSNLDATEFGLWDEIDSITFPYNETNLSLRSLLTDQRIG